MKLHELFEQTSDKIYSSYFQISKDNEKFPAAILAKQDNIAEKVKHKDFGHLKLWFEKNGFTLLIDGIEVNFPADFEKFMKSGITIDWDTRHISLKD